MKKFSVIIGSIVMTFATAVAALTSTFAWFMANANANPVESDISLTVKAPEMDLKIVDDHSSDWEETVTVTDGLQTISPIAHKEAITFANVTKAENWYYRFSSSSIDPGEKGEEGATYLTEDPSAEISTFNDYFYRKRFYFKSASGIKEGLKVDSVSFFDDDGVTPIEAPNGLTCLFVGTKGYVEYNTNVSSEDVLNRRITSGIFDTDSLTPDNQWVDVYMYIDGNNDNVTTANIENVKGKIAFTFTSYTPQMMTVYLQSKDAHWGADGIKSYIYAWENNQTTHEDTSHDFNKNADFPGEEMTKEGDSYYDVGCGQYVTLYSYTFPDYFDGIIFSRVNPADRTITGVYNQTTDIAFEPSKNNRCVALEDDAYKPTDNPTYVDGRGHYKWKVFGWIDVGQYTVTFKKTASDPEPYYVLHVDEGIIAQEFRPANPELPKQKFLNWAVNSVDIDLSTYIVTGDTVITGKWEDRYSVVFKKHAADVDPYQEEIIVDKNTTLVAAQVPAINPAEFGKNFDGWDVNNVRTNPVGYQVTSDVTFIADFSNKVEETYTTYIEIPNDWKQTGGIYTTSLYLKDSVSYGQDPDSENSPWPGVSLQAKHVRYDASRNCDYYEAEISTLYDTLAFVRINKGGTTITEPKMATVDITVDKAEQEGKFLRLGSTFSDGDYTKYNIGSWNEYLDYTVEFKDPLDGEFSKIVYTDGRLTSGDLPIVVNRPGKHFEGWTIDGVTLVDPTAITITSNTDFYIKWRDIPVYSVMFLDGQGGSQVGSTLTIEENTTIPSPSIPNNLDKDYYIFQGWSIQGGSSTVYSKSEVATLLINANTIFYAVWADEVFEAKVFNSDGTSKASYPMAINSKAAAGKVEYYVTGLSLNKEEKVKIYSSKVGWIDSSTVSGFSYQHKWTNEIVTSATNDYVIKMTSTSYGIYYRATDKNVYFTAEKDVLFYRPTSNWESAGATIFVYYWYSGGDGWIKLTGTTKVDGYFKFSFPREITGYKFVRKGNSNPGWDGKWNESGDFSPVSNTDMNNAIEQPEWYDTWTASNCNWSRK